MTYVLLALALLYTLCVILDTCGGRIEATNGTITSPWFPGWYPHNRSCMWEIIVPAQFKITLNFTHFDLEGKYGKVKYDGF